MTGPGRAPIGSRRRPAYYQRVGKRPLQGVIDPELFTAFHRLRVEWGQQTSETLEQLLRVAIRVHEHSATGWPWVSESKP